MLAFYLCSILLYKFNYVIEPNQTEIILPFHYEFQEGGTYSINITNGGNDDFILSINHLDQINFYLNNNEMNIACSNYTIQNHDNILAIHMNNGNYNLTGIINVKTTYKTIIKSCSNNHKGFSIELIYLNPDSQFSYEVAKALKFLIINNFTHVILFSIWIINWLFYFSLKNTLHLIITITFFVFMLSKIINYYHIKKIYEFNQISIVSKLYFYFNRLRDFFYFTTFFLIISGFCIRDESKMKSITITIFLCCFYLIVFPTLYNICNDFLFYIISLFIHAIINAIVMNLDYISIKFDDFCVLYNAKIFAYLIYDIFEYYFLSDISSSEFGDLWIIYISVDIIIMIFNCIFAYSMKMNEDSKENYKIAFTPDYMRRYISNPDKIFTIPKNTSEIDQDRYRNCYNLKTIDFNNVSYLIKINSGAFQLSSIEYIKIPSTVRYISYHAFYECKKLQYIEFMEKSSILVFENFLEKSSINKINIPSSLIEIQDSWCLNIPNLNNISISPLNLYFIYHNNDFILKRSNEYSSAFDVLIFSRRNIQKVTIPPYVKRINQNAFNQCKKIRYINFQNDSNLFHIGPNAFSESSINRITIPNNVTLIDKYAFAKCKNLKQVFFEKDSKLQKIEKYAFSDSTIESIEIPSNIIEIEENTFLNCSKLKRILISDDSNLKIIEKNAFNNSAITSFSVTSNVYFIKNDAFANCKNLQIVEFHENSKLGSINSEIFSYSSNPIIMVPVQMFQNFL